MTDKELIKQELERIEQILDDFNKTHNNTINNGIVSAKKNICKQIKSFIDSIPEEPASEDLEKEYENYFTMHEMDIVLNPYSNCKGIARHFAEWQKQNDFQDFMEKAEMYLKTRVYYNMHPNNLATAIQEFKKYMQDESEK